MTLNTKRASTIGVRHYPKNCSLFISSKTRLNTDVFNKLMEKFDWVVAVVRVDNAASSHYYYEALTTTEPAEVSSRSRGAALDYRAQQVAEWLQNRNQPGL